MSIDVRWSDEAPVVHGPPCMTFDNGSGFVATWSFDGTTLEATTDRFGLQPLFYYADAHRVVVGRDIPSVLATGVPLQLDDGALGIFLRAGYFIGDDTPFVAIRALPPGGRLRWCDGKATLTQALPAPREWSGSRASAMAAYADCFAAAIARRLAPGSIVLPLSGGRDSRHILLELCRQGRPPQLSITQSRGANDDDVKVASALSASLGIPHRTVAAVTDPVWAECEKNRLTSYCADEHAWLMPLAAVLAEIDYDQQFDGYGGDILSAGNFVEPARMRRYEAREYETVAAEFLDLDPSAEQAMAAMLPASRLAAMPRQDAIARMACELARFADHASPISMFIFYNRLRREIALSPFCMLGTARPTRLPFLDDDVYALLASLPWSMVVDRHFHEDTIAATYPAHAAFPYASKVSTVTRSRSNPSLALLPMLARPRHRRLLRRSRLAPRVLAASLPTRAGHADWLVTRGTYLAQLEAL
jgi:hypothetical protein